MAKASDGRRLAMVERQVQEVIARSLSRDFKEEFPHMVTVSRVSMPADLKTAKVYISVLAPGEDEAALKEEATKILQRRWAKEIQDEINHELRLRFCPKLTFYPDESLEKILKVEGLLNDLRKKENRGHE